MGRFAKQVAAFAKAAQLEADRAKRRAAVSIVTDIVRSTPVGDPDLWNISDSFKEWIKRSGYVGGTLRGNWRISGSPNVDPDKNAIDQDGGATIAKAEKAVRVIKGHETIYIVNPMPYAWPIEFMPEGQGGSVQQSPGDMVRKHVSMWDFHVAVGAKK